MNTCVSNTNLTSTKTRAVVDEDPDKHVDLIVTYMYNPLDTSVLVFIGFCAYIQTKKKRPIFMVLYLWI